MRKYLVITAIVLVLSGAFVWFVSVYRGADRQFANAYTAYRGIEQPDPSRLDEWDRTMNEAYITAKEAFTAGDGDQALGHQKAFLSIIEAQEQFGLKMSTAYNAETKALPGLKTKAAVLDGREKMLAERIVKNETEILKIGKNLNAGALDEMRLWRQMNNNFSQFISGKIDGSAFLAKENETAKLISNLRESQIKPGQQAEKLLKQINTDWKDLQKLL